MVNRAKYLPRPPLSEEIEIIEKQHERQRNCYLLGKHGKDEGKEGNNIEVRAFLTSKPYPEIERQKIEERAHHTGSCRNVVHYLGVKRDGQRR